MAWLRSIFGGKVDGRDALAKLAAWREGQRRTAWKPRTEDGDGPIGASKFCGMPWLAAGEPWPACDACRRPMPLFVQLDLAAAGREIGAPLGAGLVQLFYCTGEDCPGEGYEPFRDGKLVRVAAGGAGGVPRLPPPGLPSFPPRRIVGWEAVEDFPASAEHEDLGLSYAYDFDRKRLTVRWPERQLALETADMDLAERIGTAVAGDKLLGWPSWIQGVEYPSCPRCREPMDLLFQVDSEDHVPYMFGDAGCGHVTRCANHPDVVAFGWACC